MEPKRRTVQYLVTLFVSLGFVTLGMSSAWPTPVLVKFFENDTKVDITKDEISLMLAMNPPGFIVGSFASRFLADELGRRATILISAIPIAVGSIIVLFATKAWLLYISIFMWSCGTGIVCTVVNIYLVEIMDKEIRGTTGVCTKFAFNFGNLLVISIGPFVSYDALNYMMLVPLILYFVLCWWIPESPVYYVKEGRFESAGRALMKLHGYKDRISCEEDLSLLKSQVKNEMRRSSSAWELFTGKQYRRAIIIAVGLKFTQIITGGVAIKQYFGVIMSEAHVTKEQQPMVFIIFGAVSFVIGIMSSVLVDRIGRRPLLIWSYAGTGLSLISVGIYFFVINVIYLDHDNFSTYYGYLPLLGILFSSVISTLGFNSLLAVIPAEIFPLNIRSVAMASLNIFGGVLGFILASGYQKVKDYFGIHTVFWIFSIVGISGAVFSYFLVPETKGKDLVEIQRELQGSAYDNNESDSKVNDNNKIKEIELKELNTKDVEAN